MVDTRVTKFLKIISSPYLVRALLKGSAAGFEHYSPLQKLKCQTVVDIGANRGQFALIARNLWSEAMIYSFEPLIEAANVYQRIFSDDIKVKLFQHALGDKEEQTLIHVTKAKDSSSLLPISNHQTRIFPGTQEIETRMINSFPLDNVINLKDIIKPALLKIDVQGYELNVLLGSERLLNAFEAIYVECSFIELYDGQSMAFEIIDYLYKRKHYLIGVYNLFYDKTGRAIQGDFLFQKG